MTLLEQIQTELRQLPEEKQSEVLDFVTFLRQQTRPVTPPPMPQGLAQHPAFGSWRARQIDALQYEQALRAEWDEHL